MEIALTPELESRLKHIASETGRPAEQMVRDMVANYLDHEDWFRREVGKGLESLDSGRSLAHEEIGRRLQEMLRS